MRKRLITPLPQVGPRTDRHWFDLASVATVEVTSETKDHPVEYALLLSETGGWRAAQPGAQLIRLLFDHPLRVKRISLVFEETENARTQEFVLRWSSDLGRSFREMCGSSGISVRREPYRNWRTTGLIFSMSQ
jgi:hypothetical protein